MANSRRVGKFNFAPIWYDPIAGIEQLVDCDEREPLNVSGSDALDKQSSQERYQSCQEDLAALAVVVASHCLLHPRVCFTRSLWKTEYCSPGVKLCWGVRIADLPE